MRKIVRLMKNWQFIGPEGNTTPVDLPHTWNAIDGQDGGNDYWRGTCVYRTRFAAPAFEEVSQQVWLQFEGVNASAKVVSERHRGLRARRRLFHVPRQHHHPAARGEHPDRGGGQHVSTTMFTPRKPTSRSTAASTVT